MGNGTGDDVELAWHGMATRSTVLDFDTDSSSDVVTLPTLKLHVMRHLLEGKRSDCGSN